MCRCCADLRAHADARPRPLARSSRPCPARAGPGRLCRRRFHPEPGVAGRRGPLHRRPLRDRLRAPLGRPRRERHGRPRDGLGRGLRAVDLHLPPPGEPDERQRHARLPRRRRAGPERRSAGVLRPDRHEQLGRGAALPAGRPADRPDRDRRERRARRARRRGDGLRRGAARRRGRLARERGRDAGDRGRARRHLHRERGARPLAQALGGERRGVRLGRRPRRPRFRRRPHAPRPARRDGRGRRRHAASRLRRSPRPGKRDARRVLARRRRRAARRGERGRRRDGRAAHLRPAGPVGRLHPRGLRRLGPERERPRRGHAGVRASSPTRFRPSSNARRR